MKKTAAALIAISALAPIARADSLVYERQLSQPSAIHHGLVNGIPVLIDIYGANSIQAAHKFGRSLVGHHSFAESKQLIVEKAEGLYPGQPAMIRWYEQDCAAGYDQEVR